MESILIGGKNYISSKRAAEILGYTQDYVGQLCRAGKLLAERISGSWYVSEEAVSKKTLSSDTEDSQQVKGELSIVSGIKLGPTEIILEGLNYISSKRAAEILGYTQDYVGQLCRAGKLEARLVGRGWYIPEYVVLKENSAPVSLRSVSERVAVEEVLISHETERLLPAPSFYLSDERPLIPLIQKRRSEALYRFLNDDHGQLLPIEADTSPVKVRIMPVSSSTGQKRVFAERIYASHEEETPRLLPKLALLGASLTVAGLLVAMNVIPHTEYFSLGDTEERMSDAVAKVPENGALSSYGAFVVKKFISRLSGAFEQTLYYKAKE